MTPNEKARLDYEQVVGIIQLLTDVRFKLLALVPTISGVAVALLAASDLGQGATVVLGTLGFVVTIGIVFYEQRNTQLYNNAVGRAEYLEKELGFGVAPGDSVGGIFRSRAREPRKLLKLVPMRHDRALGLIYASVLGAWAFAAAAAVFRPVYAAGVGAVVTVLFFVDFERLDGTHNRIRAWRHKRRWPRMLDDLRAANVAIGTAEMERDIEYLRWILHDDLIFRRADGGIVGKDTYLDSLHRRTYDSITTEIVEIDEQAESVVVTALVTANGTAAGKPFGGTFRNVRTFVGDGGRWRCTAWINTRINPEAPTTPPR